MQIELPLELVRVAGFDAADASEGAACLLALELYREEKVSLGRAAELCRLPVERFIEFAARHEVPLHYGPADLEQDRLTLARLGL